MSLREEIMEQPRSLERLIDGQWSHIRDVASALGEREFDTIFLTARGTSDHAGLYAKYLWGAGNGLPIALAAPLAVQRLRGSAAAQPSTGAGHLPVGAVA